MTSGLLVSKSSYKRGDLFVRVNITMYEVSSLFTSAVQAAKAEFNKKKNDYYYIYLKQIFGPQCQKSFDAIFKKLLHLKETVMFRILNTEFLEGRFVTDILTRNQYVSKSSKRPGVTVKLFHTYYNGKDVMIKTYVYDGNCPSLDDRILECFQDEVLFQYYSNQLSNTNANVITPELYSWGQIKRYQFIGDKYIYKCLYLIMEYIHGITIKECTYNTDTMNDIYERVRVADQAMIAAGIHHNDLHGGNVMIVEKSPLPNSERCNEKSPLPNSERCNEKSPLPDIVILDFGEASFGPRKPLYK